MPDMKLLENVQRRWTKRIDAFENITYSLSVKDLDLFLVVEKLLRADVIKCWKIFHNKCGLYPEDIFILARISFTRGHSFKIVHERLSQDWKRRSLSLRVASTWNSLPDDVVALETLGSFKRDIRCCLNKKKFTLFSLLC